MTEFTPTERFAIAMTLTDMEGWGTLYGDLVQFDAQTGEQLDSPMRVVGVYDRTPRRGLPTNWQELFVDCGWVDLVRHPGPYWAWRPTNEGRRVRDQWLPKLMRGRS